MPTEYVIMFDTDQPGIQIAKLAGSDHLAANAIISGKIAANAVTSSAIASGQIGTTHIAAASILSALVGANALATPHIANQGILSASFGANALATPHIANQGILSASFGAGAVGHAHIVDFGLVSGKYASGSITEAALASGISIDISETVQEPSYRAAVTVAAYGAMMFTASGYFSQAQPGTSGRIPAVALAAAAVNSGDVGTLLTFGRITNTGWNFSGYVGRKVFVHMSSEIAVSSPLASGNYVQGMGQVIAPSSIFLAPDPTFIQIGQ